MKMTTTKILLFILACHCFIKGSYCRRCYYEIGCFDNKAPFNNALLHIPQPPNELGVTYKLFTRRNLDSPQFLKTSNSAVEKSNFNISTITKFIIHGYKHSSSAAWDIKMKDEILKRENVNVILVDWVKGARSSNYAQVAANTRVVGALLWNFMKTLNNVANGNYYARMHLIGHSLGSHIAGYTGGIIERAGRITGLDPAGPLFDGTDPAVRLDSTDADFVDVIHTDRTGFGMKHSTGHVDFYPNGGEDQPGCKASISEYFVKLIKGEIDEIENSIACSHMRAIDLFTESINSPCWFLAFPNEKAATCDTVCSVMGYDSPSGNPIGDRFLYTESYEPYCRKPNSDPGHPDYIPSIYMRTADSSLQGAMRLNRYNSAQKRRFGLVADNKVTKKRKIEYGEKEENGESESLTISGVEVMEANDDAVTSEIVNCTPVEDKQEVIGCSLPLREPERQMLMDEIDNLRYERNMFSKKLVDTETKLKTMQLSIELDKKCKFYTGLSWDVFLKTFSFLDSEISSRRRGNVSNIEQFFMTLVKLRQNPKFEYLADQCNLGKSTVIDTFWKWVTLIESQLGFMIHWPDRDTIFTSLPDVFKTHFPRLTNIIDCFEIFIDTPKLYKAKAECYSNYKKHTTVKFLVACNLLGSVVFLSKAWGGCVSDIEISRKSGYISREFHHPGDQILADRGFTLQEDMETECSAELILPAFTKGKKQLSAREVEQSRKLSSVRIHIERVIGLLKTRFSILQGTLPIRSVNSIKSEAHNDILSSVDKLVRTCAILTNLGDGIVLTSDAQGEKKLTTFSLYRQLTILLMVTFFKAMSQLYFSMYNTFQFSCTE